MGEEKDQPSPQSPRFYPAPDMLGPMVEVPSMGVVVGVTQLATSQWSQRIIHGADIMLPAGALMKEVLAKDERISGIGTLQFRRMMTRQLVLQACVGDFTDSPKTKATTMTARFTTNQQRIISLRAQETGRPIDSSRMIPPNAVAENIFCPCGECITYNKGIPTLDLKFKRIFADEIIGFFEQKHDGRYISTVMEIVNHAVEFLLRQKGSELFSNALIAGYEKFILPPADELLRGKLKMRCVLHHERVRKVRRAHILPVEVLFSDMQSGEVRGGGVCNIAGLTRMAAFFDRLGFLLRTIRNNNS